MWFICRNKHSLTAKLLVSNQSFDKQISAHKKGGGVRRVGQWIGTGNCLQVCYKTLTGSFFPLR